MPVSRCHVYCYRSLVCSCSQLVPSPPEVPDMKRKVAVRLIVIGGTLCLFGQSLAGESNHLIHSLHNAVYRRQCLHLLLSASEHKAGMVRYVVAESSNRCDYAIAIQPAQI